MNLPRCPSAEFLGKRASESFSVERMDYTKVSCIAWKRSIIF